MVEGQKIHKARKNTSYTGQFTQNISGDYQRRFKIKKKTDYENIVSQEEKEIVGSVWRLGVCAAALVLSVCAIVIPFDLWLRIVGLVELGIGSIGFSAYLKRLIESISRKTMYEGKIEDINLELLMYGDEESKGMRR